MRQRIDTLPNLGPRTAQMLEEVGIAAVAELHAIGAAGAWRRIKFALAKRVSLVGLYAIEAVLRGCLSRDLADDVKEELRRSAGADPAGARRSRKRDGDP